MGLLATGWLTACAPSSEVPSSEVRSSEVRSSEVSSTQEPSGETGSLAPASRGDGAVATADESVAPGAWFADVTKDLGIEFRHADGRSGAKYYIETAASGGGLLDVDADGDLDLFLLQGGPTPGGDWPRDAAGEPVARSDSDRLYENREGRFVEVTEAAGISPGGYGMGVCAGDVDADGVLDFLATHYGPDRLYRGLGGGRFEEIAARAGVDDSRWSTSCAFGDVDGDGDLDLYVAHYVDFSFDENPYCGDRARGLRAYCRPEAFDGVTDSLFFNQGDGTFVEDGTARGLAQGVTEKGFGVVMSDLDADGDLDIYVANDGTMNRLYRNDGTGHFADEALYAGVGFSEMGAAEAGMGATAGDADGDGRLDLVVTNYSLERNALYLNRGLDAGVGGQPGSLLFEHTSSSQGLDEASFREVGWGVQLFEADNDGDLDLAVANGHAVDNIEIFEAGLAYRQPNQLFENRLGESERAFVEVLGEPALERTRVSRALAVGDIDRDGRLDLLVTNTNDPPELLRNVHETANRWLSLELVGPSSNRFAIGARVALESGGVRQVREVRSGGGFLAQSDLRLHFGLGTVDELVTATVRWPDGRRERFAIDAVDRRMTLRYGEGVAAR